MRLPKKIDRGWAQRHGACTEDVVVFLEHWSEGVELTRANLLEAASLDLHHLAIDWFADTLLGRGSDAWDLYHAAELPAYNLLSDAGYGRAPRRTYLRACAVALADALRLP